MDNVRQISSLLESGCRGPISYEAFSPEVQGMNKTELKNELKDSIGLIFS